jgi:hypothetical protein
LPSPGGLLDAVPPDARLALVATVLAFVAWFVLLGAVLVGSRPLPVRSGPPTQDLQGDEPPAVVSVLAGGWVVTEDAAESTLLDLAARGYLELRQPDADPRHTTVHVTADSPRAAQAAAARRARVLRAGGGSAPLTSYERQVLDHVSRIAVGGVVPLTALTFRDPGRAATWARRFEAAVLADARARGLIGRRVPAAVVTLLTAAAVLPGLGASWLCWQLDSTHDAGALFVGVIPWGMLGALAARPRGYRGTRRGREVAARWFGLRDYLRVDRAFAQLPPSAVAVWDRFLAYGDALGVTHVASAVIDLGMANRKRVWSSYGGAWHQVSVRYPAGRPRYGTTAGRLLTTSLLTGAVGYGLVRLAGWEGFAAVRTLPGRWSMLGTAVPLLGLLLAVLGVYRFARTLGDLVTARTLRGEVLWVAVWRSRRRDDTSVPYVHYLAVDDGSGDRTTAWALPEGITRGFGPGDVVELTVRPWSRRVTRATVIQSRHVYGPDVVLPVPDAGPGVPAAVTGPGGGELLTAAELSSLFGVPLVGTRMRDVGLPLNAWLYRRDDARTADAAAPAGGMSVAAQGFRFGGGASGVVGAPPDAGDRGDAHQVVLVSAGSGLVDRMLLRAHREDRPLTGLGDEAYLGENSAVARRGEVVVRVAVPAGLPMTSQALLTALRTALSRLPS